MAARKRQHVQTALIAAGIAIRVLSTITLGTNAISEVICGQ